MEHTPVNDNYFNLHPYHIVGRVIEPIEVIESWGLNYHLSCALKCISTFPFQGEDLTGMKEAIWYLDRFLALFVEGEHEDQLMSSKIINVFDIALDWKLDCDLTMALMHLFKTKEKRAVYHVKAAKTYIENYINNYKVSN